MTNSLNISVTPIDDLIDVPRTIIIEGAVPHEKVEITAKTSRNNVIWKSHVIFVADENGRVDLTSATPVSGDYSDPSPMGIIWSQKPEQTHTREVFNASVSDPLKTEIEVITDNAHAKAAFIQRLHSQGVTRQEVRENGLIGTLFTPPGQGPFPAILILNGSGGGINEPRAALYASKGYIAFALAYFKAPGLSDYISNTHLEYFVKGIDWLRAATKPLYDFVAVSGQSRGGELVLLLASLFPDKIDAVLGYVPSALVHSGQNAADPAVGREGPTWLLNGKPLTHQWENNRTASWKPYDEGPSPHRNSLAMLTALNDKEAVAKARIPVENIQAPVLLFSAADDGSWPSSIYCKMIMDKLKETRHPYSDEWYDYPDTGHAILFPFVPTTQTVYQHPVSHRQSLVGGTPEKNAFANQDAWQRAQAFLKLSSHAKFVKYTQNQLLDDTNTPRTPTQIDRILNSAENSPLFELHHQREKVSVATEQSQQKLFDPDLKDVALTDRYLVAIYAAVLNHSDALITYYCDQLKQVPFDQTDLELVLKDRIEQISSAQLKAILTFTKILITKPIEGDKQALTALSRAGLTTPAIVAIAQLIAFMSYQIRVIAGLKALDKLLEE